jgi:hypothetical protein
MLRFQSHRYLLPSFAEFAADPAGLRALAPLTKTACISPAPRTPTPSSNRHPQPVYRRDLICASPTHIATIPIRPIPCIQFP